MPLLSPSPLDASCLMLVSISCLDVDLVQRCCRCCMLLSDTVSLAQHKLSDTRALVVVAVVVFGFLLYICLA